MKFNFISRGLLLITCLLDLGNMYSQNYRNAQAYLDDFEKNEFYVQESLIEYSSSVIYDYKDPRKLATLERIYNKLEAINSNLVKNDIGYKGDTSMRDLFLIMNTYTIDVLKNSSLRLTDYDQAKKLDYPEIFNCFATRKQDIIEYYSLILNYNNSKKSFCKRNNIKTDRYFCSKNLFEYDAHESLFFFKANVLDAKLCDYLLTTEIDNVTKSMCYLNDVCEDNLLETEKYLKVYINHSLNNANIEFNKFLLKQNEILLPLYSNYMQALDEFKLAKMNKTTTIESYNQKVKTLNRTKNEFFDNFNNIQVQKKALVDNWTVIKSNFLRKNTR